jgi:hypothetical protein
MVESANKPVGEACQKGAGLPWVEAHVKPLLALRSATCSDRRDEVWTHIADE